MLTLTALALSSIARAVSPPADGGYPNGNTAEGTQALAIVNFGAWNTAVGFQALGTNQVGDSNTAQGVRALYNNNKGDSNTAIGVYALYANLDGVGNVAVGQGALQSNRDAGNNTAVGFNALQNMNSGAFASAANVAVGSVALQNATLCFESNAVGVQALFSQTTGLGNTGIGYQVLYYNQTGDNNTAIGDHAGMSLTGSNNVCIGADVVGVAGESNTTRIKNVYASLANARAVYVNSDDKIGTLSSSRRYKEEIKPMDKASETILALQPVCFRYKPEIDGARTPMFGLIAEEVEKVNPELVGRNEKGEVETVRYDAINAMLLNEFLKEHRTVQELRSTMAKQAAKIAQQENDFRSALAQQQKQIKALAAGLQRVGDQLEISQPAAQMVTNSN